MQQYVVLGTIRIDNSNSKLVAPSYNRLKQGMPLGIQVVGRRGEAPQLSHCRCGHAIGDRFPVLAD